MITALKIPAKESFVIATTNRDEICSDESWDLIDKGDTLYVLKNLSQELIAPAEERVNYLPHYDTIVKGGMYEYYASEGQNPLPYAFAELIDNSLAATALNDKSRDIEVRLHFDESAPQRSCIIVIDNGKGMTPRQLNNWAIYRLSKFIRREKSFKGDISYFGVGGKQAIFFIGNSTRMISRPKGSQDVHELTISKDEFEKKEKNNEAIYSGFIRNRKPGDSSHLPPDDEIVARHIYHFYLHGPDGNVASDEDGAEPSPYQNINIQVKLYLRGQTQPKVIDLRNIEDDMQTLFARSTAHTFEFKAIVDGSSAVEGLLRYHPFLFDRETYPSDAYDPRVEPEPEDDHGYAINEQRARGKRPIFECFWNGRLIPYTLIEEISGVLWTNDSFQVSTNKLTFLDLEMKLKDKNTVFMRVVNGHDKRTQIDKEFTAWLKECHEKHDKQIFFSGFKGVETRTDVARHRQYPWSYYTQVEWDGRTYKKGDIVRIHRASAPLYGRIKSFMLYGDYDGDVYSTGGELEIAQEPVSLYDEVKVVPLSKLDRTVSQSTIRHYIEEEEEKLPSQLVVSWPNGMEVQPNEKRSAGKTIGDIKVEISNRKGELISKLPGSSAKKLLVELKVIWHSPQGDEVIVSHISQHGKNWPYWFRKMENMKNLGSHTIQLQTVLNESGATTYAGHQLPSHAIKFNIIEGEPERFSVGLLDGPFKVAVPFNIPLEFQDRFRNPTKPPSKIKPTLSAEGLELSFEGVANFHLVVGVCELEETQNLKIRLLPGPPASLSVMPEEEVTVENGSPACFNVQVFDAAGNATTDGKQVVAVKFTGAPGLPSCAVNCSNTGNATILTAPITLKTLDKDTAITAKFELQGQKTVAPVERMLKIIPSGRASCLQIFREWNKGELTPVNNDDEIASIAGDYVKGLCFKLLDEAGQEIEITDKMVDKVKVNWVPKLSPDLVRSGKLPDIKVPTSVTDSKYCQVTVMDGSVIECHFSVRELQVVSEDLVKNKVKVTQREGKLVVEKIQFDTERDGVHRLTLTYHGLEDTVNFEVVAGPPVAIDMPDWEPEMVGSVSESRHTQQIIPLEIFTFRNHTAPEQAGPYNVMFVYFDGKYEIYSSVDKYDNPMGEGYDGEVTVTVTGSGEMPMLVGGTRTLSVPMKDGQAVLQVCV
nr:hypothetical protein BaRGS_019178 [Batillaria attramentaria]